MNIQEASKETGISKDMIRFYEKKGLIHPKRSENNYRDYSIHDLHLLILIKQYNSLGIPLSSIQSMFLNQNYQDATDQFSKQIDQLRQEQRIVAIENEINCLLPYYKGLLKASHLIICASTGMTKATLIRARNGLKKKG